MIMFVMYRQVIDLNLCSFFMLPHKVEITSVLRSNKSFFFSPPDMSAHIFQHTLLRDIMDFSLCKVSVICPWDKFLLNKR